MNSLLFDRAAALGPPVAVRQFWRNEQIRALQPSHVRFGRAAKDDVASNGLGGETTAVAHYVAFNAIEVDRFEGRYLLSGGADSTVSVWDLNGPSASANDVIPSMYRPLGTVARSDKAHKFGITDVSWYPFDSLAFLTSSFDATVKIYDAITLQPSATFPLESAVYTHSMSPIASHVLVACGTQHPTIRLIDLRTGAATQALAGHTGAVLSTAWSTKAEHLLATGGTDGTVRLWDIRRGSPQLGVLDMEDSIGISGYNGLGLGARPADRGRAHTGVVNGLGWTHDGRYLISCGHDEKLRVWDSVNGSNTLVNFGPLIKNKQLSHMMPCLVPASMTETEKDLVLFPSEKEILMFELFGGKLVKRLRIPTPVIELGSTGKYAGSRKVKDLAWRPHSFELYSAHADGTIQLWRPWAVEDEPTTGSYDHEEPRKKRKMLNDAYRDVTRKRLIAANQ